MQGGLGQCRTMQDISRQCRAVQENAGQGKRMQGAVEQCRSAQDNEGLLREMQDNAGQEIRNPS